MAYHQQPGQWGQPPQKKSSQPWILGGVGAFVAVVGVVVVLVLALGGRGGSGDAGFGGVPGAQGVPQAGAGPGLGSEKPSLAGAGADKLLQAFPTEADVQPGWKATTQIVHPEDVTDHNAGSTYSPSECSPPSNAGIPHLSVIGQFQRGQDGLVVGIGPVTQIADVAKIRSWLGRCAHYTITNPKDGTTKSKSSGEWQAPAELPGSIAFWIGDGQSDGGPDKTRIAIVEVRGQLVMGIFGTGEADEWQIYVKTARKLADLP